jgi:hypothetical protein
MLLTTWSAIPFDEASGTSISHRLRGGVFVRGSGRLVRSGRAEHILGACFVFCCTQGLWTRITVTASAPLAALMLYMLGLVSTQEHLNRLTVLGVSKLEPWALEMIALTLTTASFFVCTEFVRRAYAARRHTTDA